MSTHAAYFVNTTGDRIPIVENVVVGRTGDSAADHATAPSTIVLASPNISRRHARLTLRTGSWWLEDLGSKNGTFINGQVVPAGELMGLTDGDTLVFGGAVAMTFHDPAATPISPRIGQLSGVWIDPESDAVWVDATRIEPPLSPKQLLLLKMLVDHCGDVVTRPDIVATVWADDAAAGVSDDAVAALVKRLRSRLREGPRHLDYIEVVKGRGVRLMSG